MDGILGEATDSADPSEVEFLDSIVVLEVHRGVLAPHEEELGHSLVAEGLAVTVGYVALLQLTISP